MFSQISNVPLNPGDTTHVLFLLLHATWLALEESDCM